MIGEAGGAAEIESSIESISGSVPDHFNKVRRSSIDRLQPLHHVLAAVLVASARAVAREIQIDADPSFVGDALQNPMAGRKVDVSVAEVVNAFEELRLARVLLVGSAVR